MAALPTPDTEMGRLFSETDWAATPLGPVASWPQSLRTSVDVCLSSRFPILVLWGPDLVMLYNDGYRPMLGTLKHPGALGRPGEAVWGEVWDVIGPMLRGVLDGRGATWSDDQLLVLDRNGFAEECYFTFSYSPVHDECGGVGGVFCAVTETTPRVLAERRTRTEATLASALGGAVDADDVRLLAAEVLRGNRSDHAAVDIVDVGDPRATDPAPGVHVVDVQEPGRPGPSAHLLLTENPQRPWDVRLRVHAELCAGLVGTALSGVRRLDDERHRSDALTELDAAKTVFFANVSHELRTPLTLIAGPVQDALADDVNPVPAAQRERLSVVARNAERLGLLVDQLLDLTRLEAGTVAPQRVPTDVARLTRGLAAAFAPAAERAGLRFTRSTPTLSREAHVDPDMVERIVLNLLSNAVKYTPEGEVSLRVRGTGAGVELEVADTGLGIADADHERVFDRFVQLPSHDARRSREGAGIGLSLVRQLAELHGGRVGLRSEPGTGTTVTVLLPWGESPDDAGRSGPSVSPRPVSSFVAEVDGWSAGPEPGEPADGGSGLPRLLVVEDNADLRAHLLSILEDTYDVVLARDGVEGLELARTTRPDLVLADVMMPRLDGLGLVRELRADPATRDVPIVMLSARAGVQESTSGLTEGADDYVTKPFDQTNLRARLAANLTRAQARSRDAAWRRAIVGSLHEPLVIADCDGTVLEVNEAFTRTFGWSIDDGPLSPPYPWRLDSGPGVEGSDGADRPARLEALAAGETVRETFPVLRRDGTRAWASLTASLVPATGQHPAFVVGVVRDVSREREARARRARAARLSGELAAASDLEQVVVAGLGGFGALFGGEAVVRVAVGEHDLVLTTRGVTPHADLDPETRAALGAPPQDRDRGAASGVRDGLLLEPPTGVPACRVWVRFPSPRPVVSDELIVADLLAQSFGHAVDRAVSRSGHAEQEMHLKRAVQSHRLVGQAVGVLIERHRVTADQGFEMLRQASLSRNIKLREIAMRVVESGVEPTEA